LRTLKSIIFHPFLFAVYPILFLYSHNVREIRSIKEVLTLSAFLIIFTLLFWLVLEFILKNKKKTGLIISLFLLLFFSYGHFTKFIWGFSFSIGAVTIGRNLLLFPLWISLLAFCSYHTIRGRIFFSFFSTLSR